MPEWISLSDAAKRLGVHRNTMHRRIERWQLTTRTNPVNLRETLIDWVEIERRLDGFDVGKNRRLNKPGGEG